MSYMEGFKATKMVFTFEEQAQLKMWISYPKETLKSMFDHIEVMPLGREDKRMALATIMIALITIIHGETK